MKTATVTLQKKIVIKVPATSANLGPGFDVLGVALKLYNEVEITTAADQGSIEIRGEGHNALPLDEKNVVWQAMKAVFQTLPKSRRPQYELKSFHIQLRNGIPLVSGLGSSAAARLCGILAANEIAGRPFSQKELLAIGVKLEGHPDNMVPALYGGLCVSAVTDKGLTHVRLAPPKLKAVVCTPSFELSTDQARKVLPKQFPLATAVFNTSRVALLLAALQTKRFDLLGDAMEDRVHQPSRESLIPGMSKVVATARKAGAYGAALSGAGPSIIALCPAHGAAKTGRTMQAKWQQFNISSRYFVLDFDTNGAQVRTK
jgi:homoserine kinase